MIYFFKGQESYGIEEDVIKPKSMKYLILWKELKKKKKIEYKKKKKKKKKKIANLGVWEKIRILYLSFVSNKV